MSFKPNFIVLIGLLLALGFGFARPAHADPMVPLFTGKGVKPQKVVESLVDTFDHVVFGAEIDPAMAQTVIAKWQGLVGITIQGRVTKQFADFLQAHLKSLSRETGLSFKQVDPTDPMQKINFIFVSKSEMTTIKIPGVDPMLIRRLGRGGGCYFLSWKKPASRIIYATIVINAERDVGNLNSCLLEEAAQSLGLPNDQDILRPSIFSDRDRVRELTPVDTALLRALYDPRMTPGMPRDKALAMARHIFSEMARAVR